MKNIVLMKNGEEVKRYRIREAFMVDGFRVFVDHYNRAIESGVLIADDGKSDRVFATEEAALNFIIAYANKCMRIPKNSAFYCDSYIVREV